MRKIFRILILLGILAVVGQFALIVISAVFNGFVYCFKEVFINGDFSSDAFSKLGKMCLYMLGVLVGIGGPLYFIGKRIWRFVYLKYISLKLKFNCFGSR